MDKKKQLLTRLFILLFSISISVAVIPCGLINIYGLFGEVKAQMITQDDENEIIERHIANKVEKLKGINIFNKWYELWIMVVCLVFIVYCSRLPRRDTIVTLKVRMDD